MILSYSALVAAQDMLFMCDLTAYGKSLLMKEAGL